jgi:hypothetical protein
MRRVARVHQHADVREAGDRAQQRVQQLEPHVGGDVGQAGDVAARSRERTHEAAADRVTRGPDDDRNARGGFLRRGDRRAAGRKDDVDLQRDQLGRELRQPLVVAVGGAVLDDEVLSSDVAELAHSGEEGGERGVGVERGYLASRKNSDAVDLGLPLRAGNRRADAVDR